MEWKRGARSTESVFIKIPQINTDINFTEIKNILQMSR